MMAARAFTSPPCLYLRQGSASSVPVIPEVFPLMPTRAWRVSSFDSDFVVSCITDQFADTIRRPGIPSNFRYLGIQVFRYSGRTQRPRFQSRTPEHEHLFTPP